MARFASLSLCLALVVALALPAAADKRDDRTALAELKDSSCTLTLAVENGLAAVPGTVAKARLKRSRKPGQEPIWFYKVVIVDENELRQVERFDALTCEAILPVLPEIDMPTAITAALEKLGSGHAVGSRLRFPGLEPVYKVTVLQPRGKSVVLVDAVTGEVLHVRKWHRKIDPAQDADGEDEDDSSL